MVTMIITKCKLMLAVFSVHNMYIYKHVIIFTESQSFQNFHLTYIYIQSVIFDFATIILLVFLKCSSYKNSNLKQY